MRSVIAVEQREVVAVFYLFISVVGERLTRGSRSEIDNASVGTRAGLIPAVHHRLFHVCNSFPF